MLALAARYDLAVVLHAPHGAAVGALEALKRHGIERAVFHWHKAPAEVTRAIVDAGYFVSVTPEVVYRERDRDLVELVPLESLLVESDAPWQYGGEFTSLPSGPWLAAGWPRRSRRSRTARSTKRCSSSAPTPAASSTSTRAESPVAYVAAGHGLSASKDVIPALARMK